MPNPFHLTEAVIRDLPHVTVTRLAPKGGQPCLYRKVFHANKLGHAAYWLKRECDFLLDFELRELQHVVKFKQVSRADRDDSALEAVTTYDAGVTLEDWLKVRPLYANGDSLKHPFRHAGMFLALLRACLLALEEIHRHGIVHCDIKEDNICLPYSPYPAQSGPMKIEFDRLKLIDFAFSVSAERPLRHRLPIEPTAPYQSDLLKQALNEDRAGTDGALQAQQLDYRADLFSLGFLAGKIAEAGLLTPQGRAGFEAVEAAGQLVERLKAYEQASAGELPHASLIGEIDGWLAKLTDLPHYQWLAVDGMEQAVPYTPTQLTPMALEDGEGGAGETPLVFEEEKPVVRPVVRTKRKPSWLRLPLAGSIFSIIGVAVMWAAWNGHLDWTGFCAVADDDRQTRVCRLWPGDGPLLWQGPTHHALHRPPLPTLADANQVVCSDGLLVLGASAEQFRIGDKLQLHYAAAKPAYLRLFVLNSSGQLETLFPEKETDNPLVEAGKVHSVDGLKIGGPAGQDRLIALASPTPLPPKGLLTAEGQLTEAALALQPTVVRLAYQVVGK